MVIKVYSIASWDICDLYGKPVTEYQRQLRFSPEGDGRWGNIQFIDNFDEADIYIQFWPDKTGQRHKCPPATVINLMREATHCIPKQGKIGRETLYSRWVSMDHNPQGWWIGKTYKELATNDFPEKTKLLSYVTTGRQFLQGHKNRLNFTAKFAKTYPGVLDIYGKNIGGYNLGQINGYLGDVKDKWDGLAPYRYSFAFNNIYEKNYFDEKLGDVILAGCMPIFYGCPNIDEFFPDGSYYYLDITKPSAVKEAFDVINSDYREDNLSALKKAKDLWLNKYSLQPTVHKIVNELMSSGKLEIIETSYME
uniref:Putative glycosyltransferase n=1 Tax=viral metagenome TaxID=1070528 RepID=A0A6M3M5M4_9ZZZZ